MSDRNTLLMPFLDKSENFTNGFECGIVWNKIEEGETLERHLIHEENIHQIEMICKSFGVEAEIEVTENGWAYLTLRSVGDLLF
jgi:hypothetical protein